MFTGQGRLDGAFCDFTEADKMEYLEKLRDFGVVNIEMECTIFAALTYHAGIRSAICCVTLLDRLKGDQVCCFEFCILVLIHTANREKYTFFRSLSITVAYEVF